MDETDTCIMKQLLPWNLGPSDCTEYTFPKNDFTNYPVVIRHKIIILGTKSFHVSGIMRN